MLLSGLSPAAPTARSPQTLGGAGWFLPTGTPPTAANEVQYLVDGPDTFKAMADAISKVRPRLTTLSGFEAFALGGDYQGPIAMINDGTVFGTSPLSHKYPTGILYKISPDGKQDVIFQFDKAHGLAPHGVTLGIDGETLFGICSTGGDYGAGTLWRLSPGSIVPDVLWSFRAGKIVPPLPYPKQPSDAQKLDAAGANPAVPPVQASDGNLYGVTPNGVVYSASSMNRDSLHGIYQFGPKDYKPFGNAPAYVMRASDGSLYGATTSGAANTGAIFKLVGGKPTAVHVFSFVDGAFCNYLTEAPDGTIYGTCEFGGPGVNPANGLVFELSKANGYKPIYYFDSNTGSHPIGGITVGTDGYLYGTTPDGGKYGRGELYRISRDDQHTFEILHAFGAETNAEGWDPRARPWISSDGKKLYGTTSGYGAQGGGVLWQYDLGKPDYIYMANWWFDPKIKMNGPTSEAIAQLIATASHHDVQIRALLWKQPNSMNTEAQTWFNNLLRGASILDDRTLNYGSHHQKLLIVSGSDGLTAFAGGVDFNLDRIDAGIDGSPLHDVHCRVRGPAAQDLLNIFLDRWDDQPAHTAIDKAKGPLVATRNSNTDVKGGTCMVQVGRTFGNGSAHAGIDSNVMSSGGYKFAPTGDHSAAAMIVNAIQNTQTSLYIEDQYFVDTTDPMKPGPYDVRQALKQVLAKPSFKQLIIVIPDGSITDMVVAFKYPTRIGVLQDKPLDNQVRYRRRLLIEALKKAPGHEKMHIFCLKNPGAAHTYVHAKTWIFDDQYAIIGSANCNRRSWTHDSEVVVGIYDTASQDGSGLPLPKHLRMRLWAEHLGIGELKGTWTPAPGAELALLDPIASQDLWIHQATNAFRVMPYDETKDSNVGRLWVAPDTQWDQFADPDGL